MATRSYIILELSDEDKKKYKTDKNYMGIYCHWDGYKSYNGRILMKYYDTKEKVEELISHGDMSSLQPTLQECIFYHRDREHDLKISFFDEINKEFTNSMVCFLYLFKNNQWHYRYAYKAKAPFRVLTMSNTRPSADY